MQFEERMNYVVVDARAPLHYNVKLVDNFSYSSTNDACTSYCLTTRVGFTITGSYDFSLCQQVKCAPPGTYQAGNVGMEFAAVGSSATTDFGIPPDTCVSLGLGVWGIEVCLMYV